MNNGQEMQAQSKAYHFDPNNIAPPEVRRQLVSLLEWRDNVYRGVVAKIEMVPGLSDLLEELTNALNACATFILPKYSFQTLILSRLIRRIYYSFALYYCMFLQQYCSTLTHHISAYTSTSDRSSR